MCGTNVQLEPRLTFIDGSGQSSKVKRTVTSGLLCLPLILVISQDNPLKHVASCVNVLCTGCRVADVNSITAKT